MFCFPFWTVDLAVRKETTTEQHCHQCCYWELEDLSFCPDSVQTDDTLSKVNYVLCLLIAECSRGPSDHLPRAVPSAHRSGTWILAHSDFYHLTTDEDTIPVDHCDPGGVQPS